MHDVASRLTLRLLAAIAVATLAGLLVACEAAPDGGPVAPITMPSDPGGLSDGVLAGLTLEVHRSAQCGCCGDYEAYMTSHGAAVGTVIREDLGDLKAAIGLPIPLASCHTAFIDGYYVEGHVPVEAIVALLTQRPDVDGITLPGMPGGSPGMGGEQRAPFTVLAVAGGEAEEFGSY